MQRPVHDWRGNLAVFMFVIVMNVLSNALPINGQTMPEISAKYPSLFTPAGFTFSIWGVIYLVLLVFVVWHYDLLALSFLIMLGILATLILIYRSLRAGSVSAPPARYLALVMPFNLYTGWITLATIANASAMQTGFGWDNIGLSAVQ